MGNRGSSNLLERFTQGSFKVGKLLSGLVPTDEGSMGWGERDLDQTEKGTRLGEADLKVKQEPALWGTKRMFQAEGW